MAADRVAAALMDLAASDRSSTNLLSPRMVLHHQLSEESSPAVCLRRI